MVPLTRELDPTAGPLDFFGAEVRRWRTAAGLSQEQLGQKVGYSGAQVGKVETGERAPAQDFADACDRAFPDAGGLFGRLYQLARRWDGGYPSWFAEWIDSERRATSICWWEPLLIPGLLQTADYVDALMRSGWNDAALAILQADDRERPTVPWTKRSLGDLYRRVGRTEQALAAEYQAEQLTRRYDQSGKGGRPT